MPPWMWIGGLTAVRGHAHLLICLNLITTPTLRTRSSLPLQRPWNQSSEHRHPSPFLDLVRTPPCTFEVNLLCLATLNLAISSLTPLAFASLTLYPSTTTRCQNTTAPYPMQLRYPRTVYTVFLACRLKAPLSLLFRSTCEKPASITRSRGKAY